MMDEPKEAGARVNATWTYEQKKVQTWTRFTTKTHVDEPWINEDCECASWDQLIQPRHHSAPDGPELANLYFQMGLATGDLLRQNKDVMPLEMIYRLMSGEKYEAIAGVVLP
jgi:hypothetical protein